MNHQELNYAILTHFGWTNLHDWWTDLPDYECAILGIAPGDKTESVAPDYTRSLDDMFAAEETLDASEMEEYAEFLGIKDPIYGYTAVHRTAKSRAEAFFKLITEGKSQL
jgi:hypothetical protein